MWKKIKPYIISIAIALGVGALAAFLTRNSMNIYQRIERPSLSPPSILFPIVWTLLYTLMGISSAKIYLKKKSGKRDAALKVYALQLALNFFWSLIFFNLEAFLFAFAVIILLWVLIIIMIKRFYDLVPWTGYLQIPYLLWVTFAAYLNLMIYILN